MTYLQILNKVLVKLRATTVTSVSADAYTSLIAALVNEAKRDVEDAWLWTTLRTNKTVRTVAGQDLGYAITGAADRFHILKMYNDTDSYTMRFVDDAYIDRQRLTTTVQSAAPWYIRMSGQDSNGDPTFDVYPKPDKVYSLNFRMMIPQDDLVNNTDVITVPWRPVVQKAYALSISERGEDGGVPVAEADALYNKMLGDAIAQDEARVPNETTWYVE